MADVSYTEQTGFGLATILPRKGVDLRAIGAAGDGMALLATGPGQWLAHAPTAAPDWVDALEARLAPLAHVIDQSGGYVIFALTGRDAARLLQKGLPIDLSDSAFAIDGVAVSVIAHIGVIVHRAGPASFHIAIFRSFAGSFRHWLDATVASL